MTRTRNTAQLQQLSTKQIQNAPEGDHTDGGGLLLRVRDASAGWVLRYTATSGRRREMGLGIARRDSAAQAGASVKLAREMAHGAREALQRGVDPIDERDMERAAAREVDQAKKVTAARERMTLARAARSYHELVKEPMLTPKHGAQWIASLEHHVPEALWHAPIDSITPPALLAALTGVRALADSTVKVPETLLRVRQRLDAVFEDAMFHGRCATNPAAAIKRKMQEANGSRKRGQFAALPYREAPAFMIALREQIGLAARCLELAALTAARTGEVIEATWSEFDLEAGVWTVPAERMKGREIHTVHLSARALEIVKTLPQVDAVFLFPTPAAGKNQPLSNMAMLTVLDRMGMRERTTVHGLCRATFSTWANETAAARPDVIEACLAHQEGNKIRAAYNRAQFAGERAALLDAWAEYLSKLPVSNVVQIARAA